MFAPSRPDTVRNHGAVVLRSSCDACTEVKMACSRGKPTCARCERRGEVCIYGPMKRAGRKKQQQQHDSSQQPPKRQPPRKSAVESRRPLSSVSVSLPPPDGGTVIGTPENTISSRQPMPLDLFMLDPKDLTNTYPAIDGAYAFTLPLPSKERNTTRTEFPEPLDLQIGSNEEASSSGAENDNITINLPAGSAGTNTEAFTPQAGGQDPFDDSDWMFWSPTFTQDEPDAYTPHHSSSVPIGTAVDLGSIRASSDISLSDNCLSLAMGILGTLTPPLAMCPRMPNSEGKHRQDSVGTDAGASGSAINTFDDIMQRNVASIEAIRPILKCQCSMNSSVVLILSHIIFQILWWYTAAAGVPCVASWLPLGQRTQLPQVPPPISATMPGYGSVEEGTQERVICQTILSKMHSVRTLVERLSQILLCDRTEAAYGLLHDPEMERVVNLGTSPPSALAISLESELRTCLRDVSRAIVAKLAEV